MIQITIREKNRLYVADSSLAVVAMDDLAGFPRVLAARSGSPGRGVREPAPGAVRFPDMNTLSDRYRQEAGQLRQLASASREPWARDLLDRVAQVCDKQAERAERPQAKQIKAAHRAA